MSLNEQLSRKFSAAPNIDIDYTLLRKLERILEIFSAVDPKNPPFSFIRHDPEKSPGKPSMSSMWLNGEVHEMNFTEDGVKVKKCGFLPFSRAKTVESFQNEVEAMVGAHIIGRGNAADHQDLWQEFPSIQSAVVRETADRALFVGDAGSQEILSMVSKLAKASAGQKGVNFLQTEDGNVSFQLQTGAVFRESTYTLPRTGGVICDGKPVDLDFFVSAFADAMEAVPGSLALFIPGAETARDLRRIAR